MNSEDNGTGKRGLPIECVLHAEKITEIQSDMRQVRLAVCGDDKIGVPGLVHDVAELKEWRRKLDLRVAGIAGCVSAVLALGKYLITKF